MQSGQIEASTSAVVVRSGELVAMRLFDIAYAIDLAKAQVAWANHVGSEGNRSRLTTAAPKAVAFNVPPLEFSLGQSTIDGPGGSVQTTLKARLYDFGVVALSARVPITDLTWDDFAVAFNSLDVAVGPGSATDLWQRLLAQVSAIVAPALERPGPALLQEDYLLGVVHALAEPLTGAQLRESVDLVALLSGESRPLSEGATRDILRRSYSYYADDLVVLTWDRAFIYEPRGDSDVADVIEVANAQLVEFRYYDELLDDELPLMYDRVAMARGATSLLASRRFAHLARRLYTLVAEVTELTEKVDNALQVTEDVYLARVYSAALELFRVPSVSAAVDRKLAIIRDTYSALYEEASSRRAELLEIAITLLIAFEIALAIFRHS